MQSKKGSFQEAVASTVIGFLITLVFAYPIYWLFDVPINPLQVGGTTIAFTVLSIVRGYFVRRYFNKIIQKKFFNGK